MSSFNEVIFWLCYWVSCRKVIKTLFWEETKNGWLTEQRCFSKQIYYTVISFFINPQIRDIRHNQKVLWYKFTKTRNKSCCNALNKVHEIATQSPFAVQPPVLTTQIVSRNSWVPHTLIDWRRFQVLQHQHPEKWKSLLRRGAGKTFCKIHAFSCQLFQDTHTRTQTHTRRKHDWCVRTCAPVFVIQMEQ